MQALSNKVAVVTGASSGIGKAIATRLAKEGARLCLVGRQPEVLEAIAADICGDGPAALCNRVDLTLDSDVHDFIETVHREIGSIDILVHSAGVISLGTMEQASIEDFDRQYRTNVRAPYVLTRAALPLLKACKGQIVFINSSAALNAKAKLGQYAATRHALRAIADSLREEMNSFGLRVLNVFLGRTASPMQAAIHEMEGRSYRPELLMQPEDVADMVIDALCLSRSAEVTEISMRPSIKSY